MRVHGAVGPQLRRLNDSFRELRAELEPHLEREEAILFPACMELERNGKPVDSALISEHELEHATTGDALKAIRVLADDYDRGSALCNTHGALLDELAAFERDLYQHVHEENNLLLPRVHELSERTGRTARPPDAVPRCCQAWVAEQSRSWALHRR